MPVLYIFSGLPGSGKSTLAQALAKRKGAVYVRIDTVEQALRDFCAIGVEGEGYEISYRIAADNLCLGLGVVADSCNPIELTRKEWEKVATKSGARWVNIEIICSNEVEHRARVETRSSTVPGLRLPTWKEVENRGYQAWSQSRIVIDTSAKSENESLGELLAALAVLE
jgi:predicted kinase